MVLIRIDTSLGVGSRAAKDGKCDRPIDSFVTKADDNEAVRSCCFMLVNVE
jgi:hypothetical protein